MFVSSWRTTRALLVMGVSLLVVAAGLAQPRVAIVAAAATSGADARFTDPQAKLTGTGLFSAVDIITANTTTPSLATLQNYGAVLVWSNVNFASASALGDVLADYVDAGGGGGRSRIRKLGGDVQPISHWPVVGASGQL